MKIWMSAMALAMGLVGISANASELDETSAPRSILVRVNGKGDTIVYRSANYARVTEDNFETAIDETAVPGNVIADGRIVRTRLGAGQSELDVERSTSAWYWWTYNTSWWSVGSWFTWGNYSYNWAYTWWYRGYSWYWYW
jgi:hypothetical protein